jgi:hypothetical protein
MEESSQLRHTPDPELPHRDTDFDLVGRIGKVIERYKIFWIMAIAILTWWGANLRESALTTYEVRALRATIDTVIIPHLYRIDAEAVNHTRVDEQQTVLLGIFGRLLCLHTSVIDRVKLNLECKNIPIEFPKQGGL